jgi:hypothetical protein
MKVLGADIFLSRNWVDVLREFGYKGHHGQFRIVCKCKSMADANRKCAAAGLGDRVFRSGWCSETGNEKCFAAVEKSDIAICVDGVTGEKYVTLEQIVERMERS